MDETTTTTTTAEAENGTAANQQSEQTPQQPDISALVTKESRKSVEKLLRDAGITPDDNPEMQLKEYKKWLDGQKSDLEKANGSVTTLTQERDDAIAAKAALERKIGVLAKGIPEKLAGQYAKLAETYISDSTPFDKALDLALKDFPLTPAGVPGNGSPPPAPKKDMPEGLKDRIAHKTDQLITKG